MSVQAAQPWWEFATAARITFGRDVSRFLPDAAAALGQRVLLVTDPGLVTAGVTEPLVGALRGRQGTDLLVWDQGEPEIGMRRAEQCAAAVRDFEPSVVVAVGGGSTMDLAKVVAARLLAGGAICDWPQDGTPDRALPVIALPTTAGTGSEVTSVAVLTDEARNVKVGLTSTAFLPRIVLVDPLLTLSCPPHVTAHSGMDALSHALEAFFARGFDERSPLSFAQAGFCGKNPVSDALALPALTLIADNLSRAVADGGDVAARESMALASLLAGMAFAKAGTGIVHALQYPVGAATKTPHGLGNAVLMPAAVRFNLPSRRLEAAAAARALGCDSTDDAEAGEELPGLLTALARSVGIDPGLDTLGVTEADLTGFAAAAAGITRLIQNNPRPVDAGALYGVLRDALHASSDKTPFNERNAPVKLAALYTQGDGQARLHVATEDGFAAVDSLDPGLTGLRDAADLYARGPGAVGLVRELSVGASTDVPAATARYAPPVLRPGKIVCVGLNYADHIAESGVAQPDRIVLFAKFPSCLIAHGEPIVYPSITEELDYEGELAVVIGRQARDVPVERALDYVGGYTIVNDVSARDLQTSEPQWIRGKALDTFAPLGPVILDAATAPPVSEMRIRTRVNGEIRQDASCAQMITGVPELIAHISAGITLEPGDIIATGTPSGVGLGMTPPGYVVPGDKISIEITGIGELVNAVAGHR